MKRMLITAMSVVAASAALAAPASAADANLDAQAAPYPCYYDETYSECVFRIARNADDILIDTAEAYVNYAGYVAGTTLDTIKELCGDVSRPCGSVLFSE